MGATPNRVHWQSPGNPATATEQGIRVLASLGKQEGLQALLAFSGLHENIRNRACAPGSISTASVPDDHLLQTERFVLHEVLQLICVRAQILAHADNVLVALIEGTDLVCRAAAGNRPIPNGLCLHSDSRFLRDCLNSGKILRCDDSETDARLRFDFASQLQARSTVLVPLRGRNETLGVVQAFSAAPWAFADPDIRCLDLFAELILSALRPADQDRRLHWLGNIAGQVLQPNPTVADSVTSPVVSETVCDNSSAPETAISGQVSDASIPDVAVVEAPIPQPSPDLAKLTQAIDTPATTIGVPDRESLEIAPPLPEQPSPEPQPCAEPEQITVPTEQAMVEESSTFEPDSPADEPDDIIAQLERSAAEDKQQETEETFPVYDEEVFSGQSKPEFAAASELSESNLYVSDLYDSYPDVSAPVQEDKSLLGAHPGLTVVLALVTVAALFSAGVWWGMQFHPKAALTGIAAAPNAVTTPSAPDLFSPPSAGNQVAPAPTAQNSMNEAATFAPVPPSKLGELPKITGVRHWSSSMGSTVVIDMEDQVNYEVHRLVSPERIYFDLPDTALPPDLQGKTMDIGDLSLTRVRIAQPVSGITRVVLDTKDGSNFSVSMETNPYRLVVELRAVPKSLAAARPASSVAKPVTNVPLAAANPSSQPLPARTGKFRIVLDAGHGGWDFGTIGREGLLEKDLVLDVTRRLGKLLQSRIGAEVMFTRTGDDYLPLDQRADFANQAQADLFVSIHANYSSSASARGVETYYTNLFSAPGFKELEGHTNQPHAAPISLSAGGLHEKIEESRRLATSVQHALYTTLAAKNSDIRDRGIKDASFVVLTGTTMPSILTEISFVSSPADEQNLQSEAYRQQIAEALFQGIEHYQESAPHARVAQLQPSAAGR